MQMQVPEVPEQPPAKKPKQGVLDRFLQKGTQHEQFHMDLVQAFGLGNIPMSKLNAGNNVYAATIYQFFFDLQTHPCGNFC